MHPDYVILWATDEISGSNSDIEIETDAPGVIAFAGDGGDEVPAFDEHGRVHMLPLIGMTPETAIQIADDFQAFANKSVR